MPNKNCFVVGPIGEPGSPKRIHTEWVLVGVIKPVLEKAGFVVHHPLEMANPGLIDTEVIEHLLNDELVVADLTTQNPNAFYEIGIRHMAQKPIIHIQLQGEPIPFDVKLYRSVDFKLDRPSDIEDAKNALERAVAAVEKNNYRVINPVTNALAVANLQQQKPTDPQRLLMEEMHAIREHLSRIEKTDQIPAVAGSDRYSLYREMGSKIFSEVANSKATEVLAKKLADAQLVEAVLEKLKEKETSETKD